MKEKIARNSKHAWEIQEKYDSISNGWIQFKGSDICMDIRCKCGYSSHIDAGFAYNVQCPSCFIIYMVNGHVELIELETEPDGCLVIGNYDDYDSDEVHSKNDEIKRLNRLSNQHKTALDYIDEKLKNLNEYEN